ncbi:BirA family transcriptional regulator, biotin operon repressor / biotin-[acetyl-CoA-carboxylase] ligase [Kytococcus aerolatus]|uniref:biotin--[biotin carboxyl-carrier protein] ligase n=1 Tax=Kytococcus aerolatus TaxID=592308 RepID=A0A212TZW9_9MICO|nr:BirA family transcriptional regulator, biotin operon repressor / biotin-[acetyl-CoA-carboxylase] ligase [Kytococcus aerolatus]
MRDGLHARAERAAHPLVAGALWAMAEGLQHHAELPSTQPVALADPRPWRVVSADHQTHGRGRRDRSWLNTAATGLAVSVTLPLAAGGGPVPEAIAASRVHRVGLVPLCVGAAVRDALAAAGVETGVKWPNDVLTTTGQHKLAGVLCQVAEGMRSVVAGVGVNVWPVGSDEGHHSVAEELVAADRPAPEDLREQVLLDLLDRVAVWHTTWSQVTASTDPASEEELLGALGAMSLTLGQEVDLHRPGGQVVRARAEALDASGALVVQERSAATGELGPRSTHAAGDVVHLRRARDACHDGPVSAEPADPRARVASRPSDPQEVSGRGAPA